MEESQLGASLEASNTLDRPIDLDDLPAPAARESAPEPVMDLSFDLAPAPVPAVPPKASDSLDFDLHGMGIGEEEVAAPVAAASAAAPASDLASIDLDFLNGKTN